MSKYYINRKDREISHIFSHETEVFNIPLCNQWLGIWKSHSTFGSSIMSSSPLYRVCRNCKRKSDE